MDAVADEAGREAVFGQLLPEVVRMTGQDAVGAVAEVRRQGGAGGDGVLNLLAIGARVAEGDDDAFADQGLDVGGGGGPFGRDGNQLHQTTRNLLPAFVFVDVGRADAGERMGAARPFFGGDMGAFDVEAFDGDAFGQGLFGGVEIGQGAAHAFDGAGDDGGQQSGDATSELGAQAAGDVFAAGGGGVVVDSVVAVHLEVDEAGDDVVEFADRGVEEFGDAGDESAEVDDDAFVADGVQADNSHGFKTIPCSFVLCTASSQCCRRN